MVLEFVLEQVAISLAKILLQVTRPRTVLLGNLPRTTLYRNIDQYPEATLVPGVVIVRVDSAIYFTNSNYVKDRYKFKTGGFFSQLLV
jgi:high affinity sulfate transporter 1